ncbi:STAS domain-containing protein [Alteromonas sp. CYL-A6]|uniref:STAS domain-containing protein n=1 Tax=Alteromonas nitratireducens TaxID=3390813 RepID=UPI0034AACBFB
MSLFDVNTHGVTFHGNLDRETLTKNWWLLLTPGQQKTLRGASECVFDLSDVERVDSAGLAWLINAIRDARQAGIRITLQEPPEKLIKLAKISDVDTLLPLQ